MTTHTREMNHQKDDDDATCIIAPRLGRMGLLVLLLPWSTGAWMGRRPLVGGRFAGPPEARPKAYARSTARSNPLSAPGAFGSPTLTSSSSSSSATTTTITTTTTTFTTIITARRMVLDPVEVLGWTALVDSLDATAVGWAVASAAAGALTQWPRVQTLEQELATTRAALNETGAVMLSKLQALEDQLFVMDQEYEAQTAQFKRQYDDQVRGQVAAVTDRLKQDFQYKLDIALNQQKSNLLTEQLGQMGEQGSIRQQEELIQLKREKERMDRALEELERALQKSQEEVDKLKAAAQQAKKLPFWF